MKKVFILEVTRNFHSDGYSHSNANELESDLNDGWEIVRVDQPAIATMADSNRFNLAHTMIRLVYILEKHTPPPSLEVRKLET